MNLPIYKSISDENLCDLLNLIAAKPDGLSIAIKLLQMRLLVYSDKKQKLSDVIISLGQELLLKVRFSRANSYSNNIDYELSEIIEACFVNDSAKGNAKTLCMKLAKAFANYDIYSMNYVRVLKALAKKQPLAFLDGLLGDDFQYKRLIKGYIEFESNPLSLINNNLIIDWCEIKPQYRYLNVASAIVPYRRIGNEGLLEWTPLSLRIIANSPDTIAVLNELKERLRPRSWSGSLAGIMQERLTLLSDLTKHENPSVSKWACKEERLFRQEIESERKWERERDKAENERFE